MSRNQGDKEKSQQTPAHRTLPRQSELDYFTNNHFSRSFNSLILDDSLDGKSRKPLNKSPPFNIKNDLSLTDTLDLDLGSDVTDEDFDFEDLGDSSGIPGHSSLSKPDSQSTLTSEKSRSHTKNTMKPLLKRSSKYFNLSIDSNFAPDQSSPLSVKDTKHTSSPLHEKSTPFNKFKRPHQLVSQSPSASPNNKLKAVSGMSTPSKGEKNLKLFKNSNMLRTKSPRVAMLSSPTRHEFTFKKGAKSPKFKLQMSSSPLANHIFDDYVPAGFDESPSRPQKAHANFNMYHDTERDLPREKSTIPRSEPRLSASDDKENFGLHPPKSAKKPSYKFVKPLQTAFESTGLMKKNSIFKSSKKPPPETPMKRNPLIIINSEKKTPFAFNESFLSNDHSIEVGRNVPVTFHSNDSESSFFKIPSSTQPARSGVLLDDPDMGFDNVPETPTKSSSKGKQLNMLSELHTAAPTSAIEQDGEPCTPISHLGLASSTQATLVLAEASRENSITDHTLIPGKELEREPSNEEKARIDEHLHEKFGTSNIKFLGEGQFSVAFECAFQGEKYAIKRNRKPILGSLEKKALLREIEALRALTFMDEDEAEVEEGKENLLFFVEAWSHNKFFYIMTEFCEGGTLYDFLEDHKNYKLDEFRVWKILIEIVAGLRYMHSKNYLHLDLKPANIFVTFDGSLKIGDFGLSTKLPILEKDFDLEGDRNYIAPELINDKIYTPFADIFSVGLIILEIATNIILPGNGTPWRKLRSGDLSDAGKLSSDNISDFLSHNNHSSLTSYGSSLNSVSVQPLSQHLLAPHGITGSHSVPERPMGTFSMEALGDKGGRKVIDSVKDLIPKQAPEFLVNNTHSLDKLVSQMLKPHPFERPTARAILLRKECCEIENRRKAGATIFEGEFGPNDDD